MSGIPVYVSNISLTFSLNGRVSNPSNIFAYDFIQRSYASLYFTGSGFPWRISLVFLEFSSRSATHDLHMSVDFSALVNNFSKASLLDSRLGIFVDLLNLP